MNLIWVLYFLNEYLVVLIVFIIKVLKNGYYISVCILILILGILYFSVRKVNVFFFGKEY